jgi:predicted trehalose synthase
MASRTPPSETLAAWLAGRRWFAAKTRRIVDLAVEDLVSVGPGAIVLARVRLDDGAIDRYCLALAEGPGEPTDALDDPAFCRELWRLVARGGRLPGRAGVLEGRPTGAPAPELAPEAPIRRLAGEQSNTSVIVGEASILKLLRRLAPGINPEVEVTRFLTDRAFANAPRLHGHLEYRPAAGPALTVAVLQQLVAGARDGWEWMVEALASLHRGAAGPPDPARARQAEAETIGGLWRLGEVTAALHLALASGADDPAFAPEPITRADIATWAAAVDTQLAAARAVIGDGELGSRLPGIERGLAALLGRVRIRHHGDLHLGQTLRRDRDGDFVIIDYEGEPLRPLAERRAKHAAVRDVAGVLRSIGYASAAALARAAGGAAPERAHRAEAWEAQARDAYVGGYRCAARGAPFLPERDEAFARSVAVFELEKAAYEVVYEANNRPGWIAIPRRGLVRAAARLA